jgi:hypothetical protein
MTVMDWLKKSIPGAVSFEWYNVMSATNTGATDYMLIYTKDPRLVKLAIPQDINVGPPVYDIAETSEQAVRERFGGMIVKHPSSLYLGTGLTA